MFTRNLTNSSLLQQSKCDTPFKIKLQELSPSKYLKSTDEKSRTPREEKADKKGISKKAWTSFEDQLLKELVKMNNYKNWSSISNNFVKRGGKQCRERWYNHLREGINKKEWNHEEQWTLALGVKAFGHKWSKISSYLPGRTDNTIKNRWNCKMNPKKAFFQTQIKDLLDKGKDFFSNLDPKYQELLTLIVQKEHQTPELPSKDQLQQIIQTCRQAIINFYRIKSDLIKSQLKEQEWLKYIHPEP